MGVLATFNVPYYSIIYASIFGTAGVITSIEFLNEQEKWESYNLVEFVLMVALQAYFMVIALVDNQLLDISWSVMALPAWVMVGILTIVLCWML